MGSLSMMDIVVITIGAVILLVYIILFILGSRHADLFLVLDDKEFPVKEVYFVGYAFWELLNISYQSESDTTTRKMLSVLYGPEYVDFYIRAVYSQKIAMALTIACFALPAYAFSGGSLLAFVAILGIAVFAYFYYGRDLPDRIEKRKADMMSEFSEVVSKLALLVNAGMILHDAWRVTAESGQSSIYQEMQKSVREVRNGKPEGEAIFAFGQRCMLPEIKKFSTTLIQGMNKGNSELSAMLITQSKEVWSTKQQMVMREGELASDKLLLPILIIFIGILIMVLVPIFSGIGG